MSRNYPWSGFGAPSPLPGHCDRKEILLRNSNGLGV